MERFTTIFRYARVSRPVIYDLARRTGGEPELAEALSAGDEALAGWAEAVREELGPDAIAAVESRYRSFFKSDPIAGPRPPGRGALAPGAAERITEAVKAPEYNADLSTLLRAAVVHKLKGDAVLARKAARWRQLLEALPALPATERPPPDYAPPMLRRFVPTTRASVKDGKPLKTLQPPAKPEAAQEPRAADDVALLWRVRNRFVLAERARLERLVDDAGTDESDRETAAGTAGGSSMADGEGRMPERTEAGGRASRAMAPSAPADPAAAEAARRAAGEARRREAARRAAAVRARNEKLAAARRAARKKEEESGLTALLTMDADAAAGAADGVSVATIKAAQDRLTNNKTLKEKVAEKDKLAFCRIYDAIASAEDTAVVDGQPSGGYVSEGVAAVNTALSGALSGCFAESPEPSFGDDVRLLGIAKLIRVDERFIRYSEGEIARVENVLAGEHRTAERKSLREHELTDERSTEETISTGTETTTSTTSELANEVANELSSRFSTDVSTSASGGGGGSVGVVSFEGEGAVAAGTSLGVDVASRSETRSELGREIVEASVEKMQKTTRSRRVSRSRTLHETLERLEVDNSGGAAQNRRGIYTFLDKHVCVTETPYGLRWFLKATLVRPGRNLVCQELARISIGRQDVERPPDFTLSPAAITPANYLDLAGRFKAQGVPSPPPPSRRVARVYKADQTNATDADPKGLEAIGAAMMPVMKAYRRHLVTDVIAVPEGYEVQEVRLAVCHGANGMSIPVDLPLKLIAAGVMTAPIALSYGPLLLPAALWNVLLLASPMVHHNTDSSVVTATVGVQSIESSYYFFDADTLVRELITLFSGLDLIGPQVMARIGELVTELTTSLAVKAEAMAGALNSALAGVTDAVAAVFDAIRVQLESAAAFENLNPQNIADAIVAALQNFATAANAAVADIPDDLFEPLNGFLLEVTSLISEAAEGAMSDLLAGLSVGLENNRMLIFGEAAGTLGELPVSLNMACLKPGLTANLSACLIRTRAALEQWRLEVYAALHQSWLQMVADYEGKRFLGRPEAGRSTAVMRVEERKAIKELTFHALNAVRGAVDPANGYDLERIALFEHGIDWENMSYRIYDYGPSRERLALEHLGAFRGADPIRRTFLTAIWAQVMLPLSPEPELERAMLAWFQGGDATIGAELTDDELATLWADVVAERANLEEATGEAHSREIVLPTDHIVLRLESDLPSDPTTPCALAAEAA